MIINPYMFGVATTLNNGLVHAWNFDTNANDFLGTANGTLTNGATASATGLINQCLTLDGVNDYVNLPDNSFNQSSFTISAFLNLTALPTDFFITSNQLLTTGWDLAVTSNKAYLTLRDGATARNVSSTTNLTTGTWTHILVTYTGTTAKIYFNASLEGTNASIGTVSYTGSQLSKIGQRGGLYFLNGKIDCLAFWDRALTQLEITELYNSTNGKQAPY